MPYLLVVAAIVLLVILAGCRPGPTPPTAQPGGDGQKSPEEHGKPEASLKTREGIRERLKQLEASEPPKDLKPGAMCYDMAAPPSTADYVCPKCGEKTVYALGEPPANGDLPRRIAWDLPSCRRLITAIPVTWVELDESQYCGKCSADIGMPQLVLVVRMPGQPEPRRTVGVTPGDLVLLREFLSGADRHEGGMEGETPLKNYLPRIEQLLGVKP